MGEEKAETLLEEEKKPRGRPKKPKPSEISFEEIQTKLVRLYNFISSLMKSDKTFSEKDLVEESKDLARLANKYESIGFFITLLDPLFFVLGLVNRVNEILAKRRAPKKKVEEGQPVSFTTN